MIELRWYTHPGTPVIFEAGGGLPMKPVVMMKGLRVLQFRDGNYDTVERATGKEILSGSDWQDVQEIHAPDDIGDSPAK